MVAQVDIKHDVVRYIFRNSDQKTRNYIASLSRSDQLDMAENRLWNYPPSDCVELNEKINVERRKKVNV